MSRHVQVLSSISKCSDLPFSSVNIQEVCYLVLNIYQTVQMTSYYIRVCFVSTEEFKHILFTFILTTL